MARRLLIFSFLFLCGCYTVSVLQTPKVLKKGEVEFGCGATYPYDFKNNSFVLYELMGNLRVGVGGNTDIGLRVYGKPEIKYERVTGWGGVYADIKHQFTDSIPYISGVLGFSYALFSVSLYPTLIIGTERSYISAGVILIGGWGFNEGIVPAGLVAKAAVGYSIGSKLRLIPEVGVLLESFRDEDTKQFPYLAFCVSVRP